MKSPSFIISPDKLKAAFAKLVETDPSTTIYGRYESVMGQTVEELAEMSLEDFLDACWKAIGLYNDMDPEEDLEEGESRFSKDLCRFAMKVRPFRGKKFF